MAFKVNDKVSLQDDKDGGYVIGVSGTTITWKNTMGEVKENSQDELKAAEGMMAFFRSEAPDLIEIAENTAAFALIQGVTRNKILAMPTMEFLVEDLLYEILLKTYAGEYAVISPLDSKYPLTQEHVLVILALQEVNLMLHKQVALYVHPERILLMKVHVDHVLLVP